MSDSDLAAQAANLTPDDRRAALETARLAMLVLLDNNEE